MRYIKKFEDINLSDHMPITNKEQFISYYSCDDCDELWDDDKEYNCCKFCNCEDIEELSEVEFIEVKKYKTNGN
jgi:hypothetical protein